MIATTNRDLMDEVRKGTFREDLYYRLNVIDLRLPPLRQRPNDIVLLAKHFARKYAEANGVPGRPFTAGALDALRSNGWRGNVRELENTIHRSVLLAQGDEINADAVNLMPSAQPAPANDIPPADDTESHSAIGDDGATVRNLVGRTVAEVERDLIIDTLYHCIGNRTHAANILGISIRTLRNKLKQYTDEGIPVPMPGDADRAVS